MTVYRMKEWSVFGLFGMSLVMWAPRYSWMVVGLLVAAYAVLTILSSRAFRAARDSGFLKESQSIAGSRKAFFIAQGCPQRWLVKRHIRANW